MAFAEIVPGIGPSKSAVLRLPSQQIAAFSTAGHSDWPDFNGSWLGSPLRQTKQCACATAVDAADRSM